MSKISASEFRAKTGKWCHNMRTLYMGHFFYFSVVKLVRDSSVQPTSTYTKRNNIFSKGRYLLEVPLNIVRICSFFIVCILLLACNAQQVQTNATIVDPNGNPYAGGTGSASINCPGNQQPLYNGFVVPRNYTIVGLDGNGHFTLVLYDVNLITTTGCSYNFAITSQNGLASFTAPSIGASGSGTPVTGAGPVNLSTAINAYAVPIPSSGGGGGATIKTNNVNNANQTLLNFQTSTANASGLTVTPSNPSSGNEKFEVTGSQPACTPTVGGLVPTPPNLAAQSLLGNCTWGNGAGSYGNIIDALNYGVVAGGQRFDASFNTSTTISFPNADCPTTAKVGWLIFGTTHPLTFSGNGSLVVPLGTITVVCTLASGTLTVSNAATGNCTPNSTAPGTACEIDYSPDNTTPLTNFWTAVLASPCIPGVLGPGTYLVKKGLFNGNPNPMGACAVAANVDYEFPTLTSLGNFPGSTLIVPTPDFDTTTGFGNSCGGDDSTFVDNGCFFASPGIQINGIEIWGAGQPLSGLASFVIAKINGGQYFQVPVLNNVIIAGWAAKDIGTIGMQISRISAAYLTNVAVNAAGGEPCQFNGTIGNVGVIMKGGACANGADTSTTGASCAEFFGLIQTDGVTLASIEYGAGSQECVIQQAGTWNSTKDYVSLITITGTDYDFVQNGGVANLSQDLITDYSSTGGHVQGIVQIAGTVQISNSIVVSSESGGSALVTSAGTKLQDLCGNTITTTAANSFAAGTLVNCAMEPSIGGRCLLASAAGPLACVASSTGKFAVPISTATYTVNTSTVPSGGAITVTPTTDNTGIPGAPTCGAEVFGDGAVTATVAGVSFAIAQASAGVVKCYQWSIR